MIHLKTPAEIKIMQEGGAILRKVVDELMPMVKPGITTEYIDKKAVELITKCGGEVSFNKVPGYKWATCVPVNEQIVHTPPSKKVLKEEDVLTVDIGVFYKGFHTDYADTVVVGGTENKEVLTFLEVGKKTLDLAIAKAINGHYIGEISEIIEKEIYGHKYHILRELTGHGVGHDLHEDPFVPGFLDRPVHKTYKMRPGLVIAIEIIYSMGTEDIAYESSNRWSIVTKDRSLSACFEKTVAITNENTCILT
ncbi:MAG: hypothetical protein RI947_355 [Candidatus Parcubacteria bacterium]|jgi:methionyl aminopeptidase